MIFVGVTFGAFLKILAGTDSIVLSFALSIDSGEEGVPTMDASGGVGG